MEHALVPSGDLSLARKSILPGRGFFVPDQLEADLLERRLEVALSGARVVVVADGDADGLAATALVREAHDDIRRPPGGPPGEEDETGERDEEPPGPDSTAPTPESTAMAESAPAGESTATAESTDDLPMDPPVDSIDAPVPHHEVVLVPTSPHDLESTLERVARLAPAGVRWYVCDLNPDTYDRIAEPLEACLDRCEWLRWYDHHQWDPAVATAVRDAGVALTVGDSEEECTADVALRELESVTGQSFAERYRELAAVTRDHDLWLKEDSRSDDLADLAYWLDAETYVELVREHGPDLPPWAGEYLAERRIEKQALIDRAVDRATYHEVGPYTVGVTYGRCSQNEVAEAMREAGADASIVVKPAGSASLRGTEAFDRCHEVAGLVGGGGHPKAAGCKPDLYDDALDYAHHWTTRGAIARQVLLDAVRTVVADAGTN